jgi:predicted acylesterase/phospholipase RssA
MADRASAASSAPPAADASARLNEKDVEFLALEGGGGKGFAYLGAIDMLEREHVMDRIRGFAGASAGAITAFLLSIGYNTEQLTDFLKTTHFDEFYDPPEPRVRPSVGTPGVPVTDTSPAELAFMEGDIALWLGQLIAGGNAPGSVRQALGASVAGSPTARIVQAVATGAGHDLIKSILGLDPPDVARALLGEGRLMKYLAYLPRDMGLFSGAAARALFEGLLRQAAAKRKGGLPSSYENLGFQRHYEIFGKELLFTGTNLRSGKTHLFSRTATPYFPVADAVRISMGLPWVFKPYVIQSQNDELDPPCGVYVDGGVWNNLPFREFDSTPPGTKTKGSAAGRDQRGQGKGPRTLGLRLEIEPLASVSSIWDLTAQMLKHGVLGSGESQVLDKYTAQCILLDTRGLDLLTFSPPQNQAVRDRITKRSRRAVCRYFGWNLEVVETVHKVDIVDEEDDAATEEARRAASAC